jgi:hypothetical protein
MLHINFQDSEILTEKKKKNTHHCHYNFVVKNTIYIF